MRLLQPVLMLFLTPRHAFMDSFVSRLSGGASVEHSASIYRLMFQSSKV